MRMLIVTMLALAGLSATQGETTFTGTLTDSVCANGDHAPMRMGPTDPECVLACVDAHAADFVLYDGKTAYTLIVRPAPEALAGKKVTVTGTLDAKAKTIRVATIAGAK